MHSIEGFLINIVSGSDRFLVTLIRCKITEHVLHYLNVQVVQPVAAIVVAVHATSCSNDCNDSCISSCCANWPTDSILQMLLFRIDSVDTSEWIFTKL